MPRRTARQIAAWRAAPGRHSCRRPPSRAKNHAWLGYTQEGLAATIGLTFQQIQKYERGLNRIGASRLYHLSEELGVPVGFFFEGIKDDLGEPSVGYRFGMTLHGADRPEPDQLNRRETLDLVRAYYRIEAPKVRRALMGMFQALANASEQSEKG